MAEKKNFLLMAIGLGAVGIIIGAYTLWNSVSELFLP
jgi:Flp pilus assembly pilin Flp